MADKKCAYRIGTTLLALTAHAAVAAYGDNA